MCLFLFIKMSSCMCVKWMTMYLMLSVTMLFQSELGSYWSIHCTLFCYDCWCIDVFPKFSHTTPIFKSLHWLKIHERINYKLLSLTYKVLTTTEPSYVYKLISVQPSRNTLLSPFLDHLHVLLYQELSYRKQIVR